MSKVEKIIIKEYPTGYNCEIKTIVEKGVKYEVRSYENGTVEWLHNGELHREDAPAITYTKDHAIIQAWYWLGKKHRVAGPAIIKYTGMEEWWTHGELVKEVKGKPLKNEIEEAKKEAKDNCRKTSSFRQEKQETLQLYEKGMLSAESVLEVFGFDPKQEVERKKTDALDMNAMADSVSSSQGRKERFSEGFEEISQTIESARRNFEAGTKLITYLYENNEKDSDLGKQTTACVMESLKVMARIKDLGEQEDKT